MQNLKPASPKHYRAQRHSVSLTQSHTTQPQSELRLKPNRVHRCQFRPSCCRRCLAALSSVHYHQPHKPYFFINLTLLASMLPNSVINSPISFNAADPNPLQDICVADLNAAILVNEVNTQRTLRSRVAIAVGGINQPHKHPRAIELGVVITTRVLYLYAV
ncbi:hypothetical protein WN944_023533 [Citrus x changshan-huyou]|uniref:Uncharacterized protein n=1 Tax=Citrus x changshan-huyou TaxID=2935761 RepID=A0AAP0QX17_9ROSI